MNSMRGRCRAQSPRMRSSLSGRSGGTAPWRAAESCIARSDSANVAGRSATLPSRSDSSGTGASLRAPRRRAPCLSRDPDVLAVAEVVGAIGMDRVDAPAAVDRLGPPVGRVDQVVAGPAAEAVPAAASDQYVGAGSTE